jgi:GTP cyclohydrolase II
MKSSSNVPVIYSIRKVVSARLPTRWGLFQAFGFEREAVNGIRRIETALAFVMGNLSDGPPLLRIHSQCITGEILGSLRCDCGDQFEIALQAIADEGRGLVIYEYQEGRGIGLMAKLRAYALLDTGLDTVEANHGMGLGADYRDFSLSTAILHDLRISRVRLLSHNPNKFRALLSAGISVVAQVPCETTPNSHTIPYLSTNKEKTGHTLSLGSGGPDSDRNRQQDPASTETNHVRSEGEFEGLFPACRRGSITDFSEEVP